MAGENLSAAERREIDAWIRRETKRMERAEKREIGRYRIGVASKLQAIFEDYPDAPLPPRLRYLQIGELDLVVNYRDLIMAEVEVSAGRAEIVSNALQEYLSQRYRDEWDREDREEREATTMTVSDDDAEAMDGF